MTIRLVLGEDSYLAREGIIRALEGIEDVDLVATCADLDELREAVDEVSPDVVLTDIRMPPTNTDEGIRFAGELRSSHPEIGVVVLSQHAEPLYATALFERGSDRRAYLLKERLRDRGELSRALQEVVSGGSVVDSRIVDELLSAQRHRADSRLDQLTPREVEILGMIAEGKKQQRDRRVARDHETRGRAPHQLDLLEARPRQLRRREPPREGSTRLPRDVSDPRRTPEAVSRGRG